MGSVGAINSNIPSADYSQGYENYTGYFKNRYRNTEEIVADGFKALNDFSLSSLLKADNQIAGDNQPWNNKTVFFIWDPDWKKWMKAAERRY